MSERGTEAYNVWDFDSVMRATIDRPPIICVATEEKAEEIRRILQGRDAQNATKAGK
jgi:hypothetical protein